MSSTKSSAAVKASFLNSNSSSQFQPLMYSSMYNMGSGNEELNLGSGLAANFYTRKEEEGGGEGLDMQAAAVAAAAAVREHEMRGEGEEEGVMKRWGAYEQEKSYSMSPLMEIAGGAQRDQNNLLAAAAAAAASRGGAHAVVDYMQPLAANNPSAPYNLDAADFRSSSSHKYSTQDMEILRIKQPLNTSSRSVQQHLYDHIPSSLTHSLELLLLPGVSDPSSPLHSHSAALPSSHLDLLHASSLHDKQAPLQQLPFGTGSASACGGAPDGHLQSTAQMWHIDKLDMAVGLGLRDHAAAARNAAMFAQDVDHFSSAQHAHTHSGLSLFLQSPQQRAQTALSLDAARYSSRTATGSVGVLRNSKYLKAAQQLLNEFCNVCRDVVPDVKSSMQAAAGSLAQHNIWSAGGGTNGESNNNNIAGDDNAHLLHRALFSGTQKDMSVYSNEHNYKGSIDQSMTSNKQLRQISDHHQEKSHAELGAAGPPSPAHMIPPPPKQLPADERCHLQMRKNRLIAMVEELDRRYQQYRDQMQLIITSFESATGMGAAAAYTTLAKKAMSRQFRGLRDTISEHINKVCKMLGEEVSSVPILSRGETPRLRLVDQRLRHQRSLQQIGMLPQQQAWRPQRGLPERSVSVLRAWLFEHFLHPYPKDSEKSMLARLTGLSRNQVSNWFINARVRLWKPMVEEMYVEESKALELSETEGSHATEVMQGISPSADQAPSDRSSRQCWQQTEGSSRQSWQQAPSALTSTPASSSFNNPEAANLYNKMPLHRDDINSFMHLHSSAHANDTHAHAAHGEVTAHQYSWMKGMQGEHAGDIGMLTHQHDHMGLQAAALMQGQLNASAAFMKNGVSLTLGLQQPPPHSSYNTTSSAYGRPSEALLF